MTEKLNPAARVPELELTPFERGCAYQSADAEICEYPDSGKFQASTRNPGARNSHSRFTGRMESGADYWDGEGSPD